MRLQFKEIYKRHLAGKGITRGTHFFDEMKAFAQLHASQISMRGWLIHQIMDIFYNIGALSEKMSNREQLYLVNSIGLLADLDYSNLSDSSTSHQFIALHKSLGILRNLRMEKEVYQLLKNKFSTHFDKHIVQAAVKTLESLEGK